MAVNSPAILNKRIAEGLTTEKQAEKLRSKMYANKIDAMRMGKKQKEAANNAVSWRPLERSARMASKVAEVYPYKLAEEHAWADEVLKLIAEAEDVINARKKIEPMPGGYVFWYDCDRSIMRRLRTLIENCPMGKENSPITIL